MNIQQTETQMKSLCLTQSAVVVRSTFEEAELLDEVAVATQIDELSTLEEYQTFDKDAHDAFDAISNDSWLTAA